MPQTGPPLEYFDGAVLYFAADAGGLKYLTVLAVDEPGRQVWLQAPMADDRVEDVLRGRVCLRAAMLDTPKRRLLEATRVRPVRFPPCAWGEPTTRWVASADVPDGMLPLAGETL